MHAGSGGEGAWFGDDAKDHFELIIDICNRRARTSTARTGLTDLAGAPAGIKECLRAARTKICAARRLKKKEESLKKKEERRTKSQRRGLDKSIRLFVGSIRVAKIRVAVGVRPANAASVAQLL